MQACDLTSKYIDLTFCESHQFCSGNSKKGQDTTISDKSKQDCISPAKQKPLEGVKLYKKLLQSSKYRAIPFKGRRQRPKSDQAQIKVKFDKQTLLSIFCRDVRSSEIDYIATPEQHINFQLFFNYLHEQLTYLEMMTARPQKLVKIKTIILKQAMDQYCDEHFPRCGQKTRDPPRKVNKRLSKEDQLRYQRASLPIPPSRMQTEYINRLFDNPAFRQYYLSYIRTDKLKKYLTTISRRAIQFFKDNMMILLAKNYGLRVVIDAYQHMPNPPLFYREIKMYLKQANIIAKNMINNLKLKQVNVPQMQKGKAQIDNNSFDIEEWQRQNYIQQLYAQVQAQKNQKYERCQTKKAFKRHKRKQ